MSHEGQRVVLRTARALLPTPYDPVPFKGLAPALRRSNREMWRATAEAAGVESCHGELSPADTKALLRHLPALCDVAQEEMRRMRWLTKHMHARTAAGNRQLSALQQRFVELAAKDAAAAESELAETAAAQLIRSGLKATLP